MSQLQPKPKSGLDRAKTGRAKGTPNKTTALLKDAIIQAATEAGGSGGLIAFLRMQANKENNGPFLALVGKVLPLQISGDPDNPLKHSHTVQVEFVQAKPEDGK